MVPSFAPLQVTLVKAPFTSKTLGAADMVVLAVATQPVKSVTVTV